MSPPADPSNDAPSGWKPRVARTAALRGGVVAAGVTAAALGVGGLFVDPIGSPELASAAAVGLAVGVGVAIAWYWEATDHDGA